MKSYIEKIFLNEHTNCDNLVQSESYWKIHKEICEIFEKLDAELNEEQHKMLYNLDLAQGGLCAEAEAAAYKAGFALGLLTGIEAVNIEK